MTMERSKLRAAEWLYRWNLSMSILGIVFTILTFLGVFTLILAPILATIGLTALHTALLLSLLVVGVVAGFGIFLDKIVRFWSAQATVATTRNPFLVSTLYQKELLALKYSHLPSLGALATLLRAAPDPAARTEAIEALERSVAKLRSAVAAHAWTVEADEKVY